MTDLEQQGTTPAGRASALQSWAPLLGCVALTVAVVGAWQAFAAPRMPDPIMHPNRFDGSVFWVGSRLGPFYSQNDVESADLLFVGDSRVFDGVDLDVVRLEGKGPAALIWGPNADLRILLPAIEDHPFERLVVALSPSTLGAKTNPILRAWMAEPVPDLSPLSLDSSIEIWAQDTRERLVEEGFPAFAADVFLASRRRVVRESILRGKTSTRELDRWVRERSNYLRTTTFQTVEPRLWSRSWFEGVDPTRADRGTRMILSEITEEDRAATEEVVVDVLSRLREKGKEILCVRFPVSPSQLAIEREFVSDERLRSIAERAGVRFVEYHDAEGWRTRDGSHLVWPEARRFTREILDQFDGDAD